MNLWIGILLLFGSVAVVLIFAPLGFGGMVSAIARTRGRNSKRLLSISGFLYLLLTIVLGIAWFASQWSGPEMGNIIGMLIFLTIGFGFIIAPLITLVIRMRNPDLFKEPETTTTAQPSNVPMTPEPDVPGGETGSVP